MTAIGWQGGKDRRNDFKRGRTRGSGAEGHARENDAKQNGGSKNSRKEDRKQYPRAPQATPTGPTAGRKKGEQVAW